jgi:hypothetical protein
MSATKPVLALLTIFLLAACGGDDEGDDSPTAPEDMSGFDADVAPLTSGNWYRPGTSTTWQWQLQETLNTSYDVDLCEVDLFDTPAATIQSLKDTGHAVLCYFSAGSWEDFREDAGSFPEAVRGNVYSGFPDERWLDIRSPVVLTLMNTRLDLASQKGCDGVEADNVDGFANATGFPITASDQLGFNRRLFNAAHQRGLAVALKNDGDQASELIAYVDLSVNERCHELDECGQLETFITAGKPVLNAEYHSDYVSDAGARDDMCSQARGRGFHTLVLPEDLDDSFRFSCDDSSTD